MALKEIKMPDRAFGDEKVSRHLYQMRDCFAYLVILQLRPVFESGDFLFHSRGG